MKEKLEKLFKGHKVSELKQVKDWDGLECYRFMLDENPLNSFYVLVDEDGELNPIGMEIIADGDMSGIFWDIDKANGNYFLNIMDSLSGNEG